jgi:hypothetical protein
MTALAASLISVIVNICLSLFIERIGGVIIIIIIIERIGGGLSASESTLAITLRLTINSCLYTAFSRAKILLEVVILILIHHDHPHHD